MNQHKQNAYKSVQQKNEERAAFNNARGLQFECYERDQIVQNELKNNTQYVKQQSHFDQQKAKREEADRKAAPSGLITTAIRD